jgi:hypothetical protein
MTFALNRRLALPAPITGPNGQAWAASLGAAQDAEAAVLRVAGVCRSTSRAPDDGLAPVLGSAYQRAISPRETVDLPAYRARLGKAWAFWGAAPTSGTTAARDPTSLNHGLPSLFVPYFGASSFPRVSVLNADEAGFDWFSECIAVWASTLLPDDDWDADDILGGLPYYDDGGLWDVEYTPSAPTTAPSFGVTDLDWLKRQIRLCKGAQAYPVAIVVSLAFDSQGSTALWDDGTLWDDGGTWDDPATAGLFTVWPLGHTWDEEALVYGGGPGVWDDGDAVAWDDGTTEAFEPPSGGW